LGYISSGEIVPEVMTTLVKRSKTGLIAIAGSMQLEKAPENVARRKQAWYKDIHKVEDRVWHRGIVCLERL